ncbi:glycoside hydrolase family 2 TIM barrel-domain containing protein [Aureibaculum luteum]|uniref:glycoside hydrolase family 2 TIM barrel-domain containing protein n=1 Tax=Aureibaculum luteum TaxID=1548456 RepID=UPI000E5543F1|nr:glycoside hydrolase family 2 TIM barrel-domain containing protein [Aureibaculum luteum]
MRGINRNIVRSVLVLSYIALIIFILFGISSVYSYLNTGADRSSMLRTEIKKIDQYLPQLEWASLKNEGRVMDDQTLYAIQNDYLDAWYVKHVAFKTNTLTGINDYYTKTARKNIIEFIEQNNDKNISVVSTTLRHHPSLDFFSEDGKLAVITDKDVVEYKRIYQDETILLENTEKSTYKIILLLEDGLWRIRHMIKEESVDNKNKFEPASNNFKAIKGINYYPQDSPWDMFGDKYDTSIIEKDFKIIKNSGLNSIRIFVPYEDFGKAHVKPEKLTKLKKILDLAESENLKVVLTLFDFFGDYSVLNWTLNQHHASAIVSSLKDHKALLGWDIKNEPNLDFESRGKTNVIAWLDNMIDLVKSVDSIHPVTIGWSNTQSTSILKDKVDIVSFHYYEDLDKLDTAIKTMKTEIPNKPLVLQEFGISSYNGLWKPFGSSDEDQANYHKKIQEIIALNNLHFMSWTLYDFNDIPTDVVGRLPWRKKAQEHYGFINKNGENKPAFKYISKE